MTALLAALVLFAAPAPASDEQFAKANRLFRARTETLAAVLEPVADVLSTQACRAGQGTEIEVTSAGNVFCRAEVSNWEKGGKTELQREFLIGGLHDLGDADGGPVRVFWDQGGRGRLVSTELAAGAGTLGELEERGALYDGFDVFMAVGMARGSSWLKSPEAAALRLPEPGDVAFDLEKP